MEGHIKKFPQNHPASFTNSESVTSALPFAELDSGNLSEAIVAEDDEPQRASGIETTPLVTTTTSTSIATATTGLESVIFGIDNATTQLSTHLHHSHHHHQHIFPASINPPTSFLNSVNVAAAAAAAAAAATAAVASSTSNLFENVSKQTFSRDIFEKKSFHLVGLISPNSLYKTEFASGPK